MIPQGFKILFLSSAPLHSGSSNLLLVSDKEKKSYKESVAVPPDMGLCYPSEFSDAEIPDGSIAYHPVFGDISYKSRRGFSTKQFISDIKAADENPAIIAHLIHIDSCGGEAFGLHEAFYAVKALKKPVYALVESIAASAGYYIGAAADKIFASSIFSGIGSIGIVSTAYDDSEWLEKAGIKEIELYSNYSPLKNKVQRDALNGNAEEFVKRFLDPMALQFIDDVKITRKSLSAEAQQGELYYSPEAQAAALIDGQNTLEEVLELLRAAAKPKETSPSIDINQLNF